MSESLLQWQWKGYADNHRSRGNLLLHIVAVPVFVFGNCLTLFGILTVSWLLALSGLGLSLISIALQGKGHKTENKAPDPFTSKTNMVARIFLEQWVTFPRFVISGGWFKALRNS